MFPMKRVKYFVRLKTTARNFHLNNIFNSQKVKEDEEESPCEDKVALITGGARGIGLSIARAFLGNGAKGVVLGDLNEDEGKKAVCELSNEYGDDKVVFLRTDVTKKKQFKRLFKCGKATFEQLDIVVNNAGLLQESKWESVVKVNLNALIFGTIHAFETLGSHKDGCGGYIINVASILGLQKLSGCPIYTGTKHAVIGLGRAFGTDFYEKLTDVKVLTICPGVTDTKLITESTEHGLKGFGNVGRMLACQLNTMPNQHPDSCGCHVLEMMSKGKTGSIWVSEAGECYEVKIPDVCNMRVGGKK